MRRFCTRCHGVILVFFLTFSVVVGFSQTDIGSIGGYVNDPTGHYWGLRLGSIG